MADITDTTNLLLHICVCVLQQQLAYVSVRTQGWIHVIEKGVRVRVHGSIGKCPYAKLTTVNANKGGCQSHLGNVSNLELIPSTTDVCVCVHERVHISAETSLPTLFCVRDPIRSVSHPVFWPSVL